MQTAGKENHVERRTKSRLKDKKKKELNFDKSTLVVPDNQNLLLLQFLYLGDGVCETRGASRDFRQRRNKTGNAFGSTKNVGRSANSDINMKIPLYYSKDLTAQLYNLEDKTITDNNNNSNNNNNRFTLPHTVTTLRFLR